MSALSDLQVVCVSNDVMPGSAVPVAAPGLRVFGLAAGLRAHGFEVTSVVAKSVLNHVWRGGVPAPYRPGTIGLEPGHLQAFLEARRPAVIVLTNSNQIGHLRPVPGVTLVYDFFAPKMLELSCREGGATEDQLAALRARKLEGLSRADVVIVNGAKKMDYVRDWLRQAGRDPETMPVELVNMCVPLDGQRRAGRAHTDGGPLRFGIAGYVQPWSLPGAWVQQILDVLDTGKVSLELVTPGHWGGGEAQRPTPAQRRIADHPGVHSHQALGYTAFRAFLAELDVIVDLFDHSPERELAMVTRTVVALSCGVPVVHPPFTEVAALIERYQAGWVVDSASPAEVGEVLDGIAADRELVEQRAEGARALAAEVIDPRVATTGLKRVLEGLVS